MQKQRDSSWPPPRQIINASGRAVARPTELLLSCGIAASRDHLVLSQVSRAGRTPRGAAPTGTCAGALSRRRHRFTYMCAMGLLAARREIDTKISDAGAATMWWNDVFKVFITVFHLN